MRKGFTLVELLVVVVVIGFLVLLVMPMIGSTHPSARQTQCRSNLRQVGIGLAMYAGDFLGWSPAHYGNNLRWDKEGSAWVHNADYDALHHDNGPDDLLQAWLLTSNIVDDDTLLDRPVVTGLGVIFSDGYLTRYGGSVLMCPSWPVSVKSSRLGSLLEEVVIPDPSEPFFEKMDVPCFDYWDGATPGVTDGYDDSATNRDGVQDITEICPLFPPGKCTDDIRGEGNFVVTNYWLRFKVSNWSCYKFLSSVGTAIVSDTLIGNSTALITMNVLGTDGGSGDPRNEPEGAGDGADDVPNGRFVQNHQGVYNVLFTDGAVKIFSDAGATLRRKLTASPVPGLDANGDGVYGDGTASVPGDYAVNTTSEAGALTETMRTMEAFPAFDELYTD